MTTNLKLLTGKTVGIYRNEKQSATLYLYGPVGNIFGKDCITASNVKNELNEMDSKEVTIHIHSYGGDAFEGIAVYNVLKQSGKKITVCVDGIAASAASIITMAGDTIQMPRNTQLMIHNAATGLFGNEKEFEIVRKQLESTTQSLRNTYMQRFNRTENELKKLMDEETFFSAEEALRYGLIDEVLKYDAKPIDEESNVQNHSRSFKNNKDIRVTEETLEKRNQRFAAFVNTLAKIAGHEGE